jgi:hypothetical protein
VYKTNMGNQERNVSLRRNVEQVGHCVAEALSVLNNDEDVRCAVDDLEQAKSLIETVLPKLREKIPTSYGAMRSR